MVNDATNTTATGGSGGKGGGFDPAKDRRLGRRAALEGWPVPPKLVEAIVKQTGADATDKGSTPRDRTRAALAVLAMAEHNLHAVEVEDRVRMNDEILPRLEALEQQQAPNPNAGGGNP
jgi:hypothetical protein